MRRLFRIRQLNRNRWFRFYRSKLKQTRFWEFLKTAAFFSYHVACGAHPGSSTLNATPPTRKPLIIAIGGFASCRSQNIFGFKTPMAMNMARPTQKILEDIRINLRVKADYMLACHVLHRDHWRFISSADPMVQSGNYEKVIAQVHAEHIREPHRTFIIGHSRGGWLAMKSALNLANHVEPEHDPRHYGLVDALFTIDPISRDCGVVSYLYGSLNDRWQPQVHQACLEAPQDIGPIERSAIATITGSWDQYYQKKSWLLRSGEIPEADANYEISYDELSAFSFTPHQLMDRDDRIWKDFHGRIINFVGSSASAFGVGSSASAFGSP